MKPDHFKLPRLYIDQPIRAGDLVELLAGQAHYLKNVLRRDVGDAIRVFNGRDGEYLVRLDVLSKKIAQGRAIELIRVQPDHTRSVHLIFSPIQKNRMDILIEKATELGVTNFHPVLMDRTQGKKINDTRLQAQILEAAEQCERLVIPALHELSDLPRIVDRWHDTYKSKIQWCFERTDKEETRQFSGTEVSFLIGPAGGFSNEEISFLSAHDAVETVSLGEAVYRVETAAIVCLARVR